MQFSNPAAEFTYIRTYSRWLEAQKRRETWPESIDRYITFLKKHTGSKVPDGLLDNIKQMMLNQEIVGSMRALWSAGPALERDSLTSFNCAFVAIDDIRAFSEILYILMCGTGVGFRVLKSDVEKLPAIHKEIRAPFSAWDNAWVIDDSRTGWANSLLHLISSLYRGKDIEMDYSLIRPSGAKLKTMGGTASGPGPLKDLHNFVRNTFRQAVGRRLTALECHDVCNMIADIVVVGGVRRSSEISLSDLDDDDMRTAKVGDYPAYRGMANNSAVYFDAPSEDIFWKEWASLRESGTGERGIFNLKGARDNAPSRRLSYLIEGINPCGEIPLRKNGLCNLTEVIIRPTDTLQSLTSKVEAVTWLGAIQSTLTHFPYLRDEWRQNAEDERLLGVSLTGQMDAPHLITKQNLKHLKQVALFTAKEASDALGINMPAAITCIKPSGTVSIVTDASPGMHPRFAKFYIRRIRISATDPLYYMMRDQGFHFTPEVGQRPQDQPYPHTWDASQVRTWVCEFPSKAPEGAITRHDVTALDQLEHYKLLSNHWAEHSVSVTIYVEPDEWQTVGQWVLDNWDCINGISFLNKTDHVYELAPYEEITEEQYNELLATTPTIDYSMLGFYEKDDNTTGAHELACVGGACEIV